MIPLAAASALKRPGHSQAALVLTQITVFLAAIVVVASEDRWHEPWPQVTALGVLGGQAYLASLAAAWGPWPLVPRLAVTASIVAGGLVALLVLAERTPSPSDTLEGLTFVLLAWAANQVPLWIMRPLLGIRVLRPGQADGALSSRPAQFGIRQLMVLTLVVAVALGLGRWMFPASAWENWGKGLRQEWLLIGVVLTAMTLLGTTTAVTALHDRYWLLGMAVSAVSSILVGFGQYSVMKGLKIGPPPDHLPFAVLMVVMYAWLQASLLLARWTGYRLVTPERANSAAART